MPLTAEIREQVRQRAHFACEFCGVTEVEAGGELTIDHFRPHSKGGDDSLPNLVYCCVRCNQYKGDYWPEQAGAPQLWHPRHEPAHAHFIASADGHLLPLTDVGAFTVERLRLNRQQLINHRLSASHAAEDERELMRYRDLIQAIAQRVDRKNTLSAEEQSLATELRGLLELSLSEDE